MPACGLCLPVRMARVKNNMQDGISTTFRCTEIFIALDYYLSCNTENCMNISEEDDVFNFTLK
jgi:hypothetical protein